MVTRIQALIHCPDCLSDITGYIENLASPDYHSDYSNQSDYSDFNSSDTDCVESESDLESPISPIISDRSTDRSTDLICQQENVKRPRTLRPQTSQERKESSPLPKKQRVRRPVFIAPPASSPDTAVEEASKRKQ